MTWADGIAAAILTAFALLITTNQRRTRTSPQDTRTESDHDHRN